MGGREPGRGERRRGRQWLPAVRLAAAQRLYEFNELWSIKDSSYFLYSFLHPSSFSSL